MKERFQFLRRHNHFIAHAEHYCAVSYAGFEGFGFHYLLGIVSVLLFLCGIAVIILKADIG